MNIMIIFESMTVGTNFVNASELEIARAGDELNEAIIALAVFPSNTELLMEQLSTKLTLDYRCNLTEGIKELATKAINSIKEFFIKLKDFFVKTFKSFSTWVQGLFNIDVKIEALKDTPEYQYLAPTKVILGSKINKNLLESLQRNFFDTANEAIVIVNSFNRTLLDLFEDIKGDKEAGKKIIEAREAYIKSVDSKATSLSEALRNKFIGGEEISLPIISIDQIKDSLPVSIKPACSLLITEGNQSVGEFLRMLEGKKPAADAKDASDHLAALSKITGEIKSSIEAYRTIASIMTSIATSHMSLARAIISAANKPANNKPAANKPAANFELKIKLNF